MNITIDTSAAQKNAALGSAKITGVSKTSEKSAAQTAKTSEGKYDTLQLSENAVKYLSQTEEQSTDTDALSQAAETVTESLDSSSDTVDANTLYSYTDTQLDELLAKGEITRLEYNTEMAKRTATETE